MLGKQKIKIYRWLPSIILIIVLYPHLIFSPNSYILDFGKDGQRAYFVFIRYIQNGQGFDFNWLNHPFGEHLFYLDCDPLLLGFSKLLFTAFPFLHSYTIGFFNLIHFVSLVLACYFLTRTFEELKVRPIFSVIYALLVGFLSPQWFKMDGNFSLSYVFYIPALIFFLIRWYREGKWRYALWIIMLISASYFSHPYLGLIHTVFVALVQSLWIVTYRSLRTLRSVMQLIMLTVLPAVLFIFILRSTDTHLHRNPVAGGYGENYLGVYEWLIQEDGFSAQWLHKVFPKQLPNYFDNASIPFIFWILVLITIISWRKIATHDSFRLFLTVSIMLIPAFVLVLFATGIFGITKFEWLYEWFFYAKQVRYVARFAWPFYYVLGIVILTGLYFTYEYHKSVWKYPSLLIVPFVVYGLVDVITMHVSFHHKLTMHHNFYLSSPKDRLWEEALRISKLYQPSGVVSLPLCLEGSFRYASPYSSVSMINGYLLSWYTQLPLVGGILIRPSETETEAIRESFNISLYQAPLAKYFASGPLLILADTSQISPTEKQFLQRANFISSIQQYSYYLLSSDDWNKTSACDTVLKYKNYPQLENDSIVIQYDLEDVPFEHSHRGNGVRTFRRGDGNVLLKINPGKLSAGIYTASCWVYNRAENAVNGCFVVQSYHNDGSFEGWVTFSNPARSEIIHDGWSYTECTFLLDTSKTYEIFLIGYDFPSLNFIVDDLLLRKSSYQMIEFDSLGRPIRYNTHWLHCK